jgi:hypothetical protein
MFASGERYKQGGFLLLRPTLSPPNNNVILKDISNIFYPPWLYFCFCHADKRSSVFLLPIFFLFSEGEKCQITLVKMRITQIGAGTRHASTTRCHTCLVPQPYFVVHHHYSNPDLISDLTESITPALGQFP